MTRIYNFSAGPAVLPEPVLKRIQKELLNYQGIGFSILEASHRSKEVKEIFAKAREKIKTTLGLDERFEVLFCHGGASSAFFQIPMNLLDQDTEADYIETGTWAKKAIKEAKRFGKINVSASSVQSNYSFIPKQLDLKLSSSAKYVYLCSNNTIFGTQYASFPETRGVPLVGDFSSDILCRAIDLSSFGIIFAGTQKNLAPSGAAVVILRKDILAQCKEDIPSMCSYKVHAENDSMFNTPPVFPIYFLNYVLDWIAEEGGLGEIEKKNREKAEILYHEIDRTDFYSGTAQKSSRSIMNITFTLPSEEQSAAFLRKAEAQRLVGLKGHRSVGGIRASMYNAFPIEGAQALAKFMRSFADNH